MQRRMTTNPQKTRESWVKMDNKKEAPKAKAKKPAEIEETEVKKVQSGES